MGWRRWGAAVACAMALVGTATASGAQAPAADTTCTRDGTTLVVQSNVLDGSRQVGLARLGDELVELGDYAAPFDTCGSLVGIERLRVLGTAADDAVVVGIQRIDPNLGGTEVALGLEVEVALGAGEDEVVLAGFQYEALRIRATGPYEISTDPSRPGPEVDISEASATVYFHVARSVGTPPPQPALNDVVDVRALAPVPEGIAHFTVGGDDVLRGHEGRDAFIATTAPGSIRAFGYGGDDSFYLDEDDVAHPGRGDDLVVGDPGATVSYRFAAGPVVVDLDSGVATSPTDGTDRGLNNGVGMIIGSNFADTILGTSAAERLRGRDGNDVIDGRGGADEIRGGAGTDTCIAPPPAIALGCEA